MTSARDAILADIRAVTEGAIKPAVAPRDYRREDRRPRAQLVELFCQRVDDYKAQVERVIAAHLPVAIQRIATAHGALRFVVPAGLPTEWLSGTEFEAVTDTGLSARQLDRVDGVISGCTVAIAETGTIALSGAEQEGRRLLTLVPDLHICVVSERQIVGLVPEALEQLGERVRASRQPITFISGPSATSDIELERVEGVHGPRNLVVLVTKEPA